MQISTDQVTSGPIEAYMTGHIRSQHLYKSSDATNAWVKLKEESIAGTNGYSSASDCINTFQKLLKSEVFSEKFNSNSCNAIVSLGGGGAPEKDLHIIQYIHEHLMTSFMYQILDTSVEMCKYTMSELQVKLEQSIKDNVEILTSDRDILLLDRHKRLTDQANLFMIHGGTIGNLEEKEFFNSLNSIAKEQDILTIAIHTTFETETREEFESKMKSHYTNKESYNLLTAHLETVPLGDDEFSEDFIQIRSAITNQYGDGGKSAVPCSKTAVFSVKTPSSENYIPVEYSSRYVPERLKNFACEKGWKFLEIFFNEQQDFAQMLFEKE